MRGLTPTPQPDLATLGRPVTWRITQTDGTHKDIGDFYEDVGLLHKHGKQVVWYYSRDAFAMDRATLEDERIVLIRLDDDETQATYQVGRERWHDNGFPLQHHEYEEQIGLRAAEFQTWPR